MTFIGIKATAIQAIFEYTRKKATLFFKYTRVKDTLFYHEPHLHYGNTGCGVFKRWVQN